MLSAVISSAYSYPAMRLASQPVHQGCVHSGPLVLGAAPVKSPAPTADRDQTVSRRFEPSSRTTLNGEQPYPWDRLQPQVRTATSSGWYFNVGSTESSDPASKPPSYPTQTASQSNAKLQ